MKVTVRSMGGMLRCDGMHDMMSAYDTVLPHTSKYVLYAYERVLVLSYDGTLSGV